jgi:hypothetical protein
VRFGPDWFADGALPPLHLGIEVAERLACDISPIDATSDEGRLTMLSFLWPDQIERFERLSAALAIAAADPVQVAQADAGEFVSSLLELPAASLERCATVVFHSIVWQYMSTSTKDAIRTALRAAGERATVDRPVCWLRMEPANAAHADLRLTTWTGGSTEGVEELLAHVGYHGTNVAWSPATG